MKTEEGNRLIAEFMGWTKVGNRFEMSWTEGEWERNKSIKDTEFNYHSNWSQLMPVAYKIKCYCVPEQETEKQQDELETEAIKLWEGISYSLACANIEMAYHSIILFIQWYNKTKSQ